MLGVVQLKARCAEPDPLLGVMLTERPLCRRDPVRVWLAHAGGAQTMDAGAPNKPFQLTASRARSLGF